MWLTQLETADLFQTSKQNISLHIWNILKEGELVADSVVKEFLTTAADGKSYRTKLYNLDLILAVGYRVRSKALVLAPDILTPKVILVTDRIDVDDQICGTFRACEFEPEQAGTGQELVKLIRDDKSHVVTTLIHKFEVTAKARNLKEATRDTFVLVDEGHQTNYSEHHARMRLALKGLLHRLHRHPAGEGGQEGHLREVRCALHAALLHNARAVEDKVVTPLLYEARHVPQSVDQAPMDSWFEKLTHGLNDAQRIDLKRKYSSERQLSKAEQKVRLIAWDVSLHYTRGGYQGTGVKGQLVAPDKATALFYRQCFKEFGLMSPEVLMSGPNVREGEEGSEKEISVAMSGLNNTDAAGRTPCRGTAWGQLVDLGVGGYGA